ncbi:hypothetical protein F5Y14DRAFT_448411 [Nemania sp. NC0429]|nr:hypothetical protein F5Y14DRAFT_448411 [Nemania sp. NC0429]
MRYFPVLLLFVTLPQIRAQNHFLSPSYNSVDQTGRYAGNSQWPLGSSQLVAFQTTWDDYRIELWQQKLSGSGARSSSSLVYKSRGEDLPQNFRWTVQTYELQFSDSPVFFFWLRDNGSSAQQTSAYFNITIETSSAAPTPSSSRDSRPSTTFTSANSIIPSTSATPTRRPLPSPSSLEEKATTAGLSTGAAAGIGVAVALGVIIVATIVGFTYFRRRKRQQQLRKQNHQQHHQQQTEWQSPESISLAYSSSKTKVVAELDQWRAELPS